MLELPSSLSSPATQSGRKPAFSLIEILVVVTILALIAALAYPALRSGMERARRTQALNHLRQIGLACSGYMVDSEGTFPGSSHTGNSWMAGLLPYFQLPTTASKEALEAVYKSPGDPNEARVSSYAINDYLLPRNTRTRRPAPGPYFDQSARLPSPEQTLVFAETHETYNGGDHFHFKSGPGTSQFSREVAAKRYQEGGVYLFADFHVEWLSWTDAQERLTEPGSAFINPSGNP